MNEVISMVLLRKNAQLGIITQFPIRREYTPSKEELTKNYSLILQIFILYGKHVVCDDLIPQELQRVSDMNIDFLKLYWLRTISYPSSLKFTG